MENKKECPCYTCIVASMCPGKEPTSEEMVEIYKEIDEYHNQILDDIQDAEELEANGFRSFPVDYDPCEPMDIPEIEAQLACPYYQKWSNFKDIKLSEFDDYLGEEMF